MVKIPNMEAGKHLMLTKNLDMYYDKFTKQSSEFL